MQKIEILIIEDEEQELLILEAACKEKGYAVHKATTEDKAISIIKQEKIDFAIIDVFLNGEPNGLNIAKFISEVSDKKCPFLFLTNSQDRLVFEKAKSTYPVSFLIKPYNQLELDYAIELSIEKNINDSTNYAWSNFEGAAYLKNNFLIKKRGRLVKVTLAEIIYIQVEGRYSNIKTDNDKFLIQSSLTNLLTVLNPNQFIKSHRNYAVNLNRVREVLTSENLIVMDNEESVFISPRMKEEFLSHYNLLK